MPLRVVQFTMKLLTNYVHNTRCLFNTMFKSRFCLGIRTLVCTVWLRFKPYFNPNPDFNSNIYSNIYFYSANSTIQFSNALYNSSGNQINNAQIIIFTIIIHKSNQIKCWFLMRGENRSTRGKTSHSRVENQQTQSTYDTGCGNRTRATLVEGKCSHH